MNRRNQLALFGVAALLAITAGLPMAGAGDSSPGDAYPLATCPVSGGRLGSMGDPVVYDHGGREIRFCCQGCVGKFKSNSAKYLAEIDAAVTKEQAPHYPLTNCPIMGREFTDERPAISHVYNNRLVRLCCQGCVRKLKKDPAPVLKKLDAAVVKAQKESYPLQTCVISGQSLDAMGGPVDVVHANRLVRLCCKGCTRKLRANPRAALAKIDAAAKARHQEEREEDEGR